MDNFKSTNHKNRNSFIYGDIIRINRSEGASGTATASDSDKENGTSAIDQQTFVNCEYFFDFR